MPVFNEKRNVGDEKVERDSGSANLKELARRG